MRHCIPRLFLLPTVVGFLLAVSAFGQAPAPVSEERPAALDLPDATRPAERAELRRELERQAKVLEAQSAVVRIVAKLVGPAVVYIEADVPPETNAGYNNRPRHVEEAGSGVIIEFKDAFYVLTNRHVIRGAAPQAVRIQLADGRRLHPTKVLEDPATDVAVLGITASGLTAVPLGDSERMQIGDFVLAIGSPFGLSQSVTFGILSAKGRRKLSLGDASTIRFQEFMQTDAAINPGNSGGPLVNLRGEVVGINTAIASDSGSFEGVGFSIPSNMFMTVAKQLIENNGTVVRAFLGVNLDWKFGPAAATELGLPRLVGARITSVIPSSPAEAAKLQPDDVILEFNHTPIEDDAHLVNLVSLTKVGKRVPVVIFRDRKPLNMTVEVGDASQFKR